MVCRLLRDHNLSHKTVSRLALQRQEDARAQFLAEVATAFPAEHLVFLDECGGDKKTQYRKCGYSLRGMRTMWRAASYTVGKDGPHMWCSAALDWLVLGGSEKERKGGRNAALVSPCDVCLSPGSRPPGCCQSNRTTARNGRRGCLHACPFDFLDGKSLAFAKVGFFDRL